jgi:hypothetical protein
MAVFPSAPRDAGLQVVTQNYNGGHGLKPARTEYSRSAVLRINAGSGDGGFSLSAT